MPPDWVADHISVLGEALTQIPSRHRRDVLVTVDGTGATRELVGHFTTLNAIPGRRVDCSVGLGFAMEACAQAAYQRAEACSTGLQDAENALAHAGSDDPDWLDFDQGGLSGHAARALGDLRQPCEAEHHAVALLTLCQDGHSRTRAQRNTILATT